MVEIPDSSIVDLFYMTSDYDTTDRLMLGMPQNTIEVVKALNYLILLYFDSREQNLA